MAIRGTVRRRIAERVSPTSSGLFLVAAGSLAVVSERTGHGDATLAAAGVLYVLVGLGTVVLVRGAPERFDVRTLWYGLVLVLAVLLVYVVGELLWARASYNPGGPGRLLAEENPLGVLSVGLVRFLRVAPMGTFLLVGFAERARDRVYAVPPLVILVTLLSVLELFGSYRGFGWPFLPVLFLAGRLVLILLGGAPLYVHGVVLRTATGPSGPSGPSE